jgi:hypothetical protein
VVGQRGRRDPGRRRGQGLQGRDLSRPRHRLQGARGHREVRLRQGEEHRAQGQDRRGPLQSRGGQRDVHDRSVPDRDGQVRQQAADHRAGAVGL